MHFPKVKVVGKIQYGSYYGELSCFFGFKFLFPLPDCNQVVRTFDRRKNYNGVKIDGKIRYRVDINVFIRMQKSINLQKWLQS